MTKKYNGEQKEKALDLVRRFGPAAASKMTGVSLSALAQWGKDRKKFEAKLNESFKEEK